MLAGGENSRRGKNLGMHAVGGSDAGNSAGDIFNDRLLKKL
jgi:hypothetical protein